MTIYLVDIPVGQSVAANILCVLAVGFWRNNCMIRLGTSLTWAFVSPWPSSTRPCLPSHNMTFGAQIVWPFRRLDRLAHTDKTDKTVSEITAPSSIISLLWTECSLLSACLSSPSDKHGGPQHRSSSGVATGLCQCATQVAEKHLLIGQCETIKPKHQDVLTRRTDRFLTSSLNSDCPITAQPV